VHPLLDLQAKAGNAAVARMLAVQREGTDPVPPAPTAQVDDKPGQLVVQAHEVTPGTGGADPQQGAAAPQTTRQFQVQYAFQGQATQATGPGGGDQLSAAHQLTAQLNVSHHKDDQPGTEQSYALQGSIDAGTGHFTGAVFQVQDALVTATTHHLQGQVFANASAGMATDAGGTLRPVGAVGVGVQGTVVVNDTFSVFLQAQDQASLMIGPRGATAANSEQVSAGIQFTFP
jgi:hypothetical protein